MTQWKKMGTAAIIALGIGIAAAWAAQTNYLGTVFIADSTTPTRQLQVNSDGSINATVVSGGGVPSIAGTANQINESGSPGATTLSLSNTLQIPGTLSVPPPAATATLTTDQSQASGGSALLPFSATTGAVVGQTVTGTSIPLGDQVASIVSTAQKTQAANGSFLSGQKVIPMNPTAGFAVGQQCTDTTAPTAVGAGNVIATIQANTSITLTSNTTAGSGGATDSITCDPVVTLTVATTAAILAGASIAFNPNHTVLSSSSSVYNQGDESINGNLNVGGPTLFANALTVLGPTVLDSATGLSVAAGITGQAALTLRAAAGNSLKLGISGTGDMWQINSSGVLIATADNTYDIGIAGTTRPRSIYIGTNGTFGGTMTVVGLANSATTSAVCYNTGTGLFTYDGTIGTCNTSTLRVKHDIAPLKEKTLLSGVMAMEPVSFLYNDDQLTPGQQIGFIAEDLEAIDPRLVSYDKTGKPNAIRFLGPMFSYVVGAIKELKAENDNLRDEIKELKRANGSKRADR